MQPSLRTLRLLLAVPTLCAAARADGEILSLQKIDDLQGGLGAVLDSGDRFGEAVDRIGDLDGDGFVDLLVGAPGDDDAGTDIGAAWILFLGADGTVQSRTKIAVQRPGFGRSVAQVGDVDLDGNLDIGVGSDTGVDIFAMQPDGSWSNLNLINETEVIGSPGLPSDTSFGAAISRVGDLDADGLGEIAIGDPDDDTDGTDRGAVYLFELDTFGQATQVAKIASSASGFLGSLSNNDRFGSSLAGLDDIDGDGVEDLAVGAPNDDDGGLNNGALWVLFLNADGTVKSEQKISALHGAPSHLCASSTEFGANLARVGDFDGGGALELLVGGAYEGQAGVLWMLFLETDGTVRSYVKHDAHDLGIPGADLFGVNACAMADHDGDGIKELVVGAPGDASLGSSEKGALYVLFPASVSQAAIQPYGCNYAPAGSLKLDGLPILGADFAFLVDNPLGTQYPGSIPFVAISAFDSASPCGAQIPGFGMDPASPFGELLVLPPFVVPELVGAPWAGAGQPVAIPAAIPQTTELLGLSLYTQGLMFDPSGGPSGTVTFGLTRGRELVIGS